MKIAVIPGDGIGPEVTQVSLQLVEQLKSKYGLDIQYDVFPYSGKYFLETGISIPDTIFAAWPEQYNAILFGAVGDPAIPDNTYAKEILLGIRKKFDFYVNYRPVHLLDERYCPLKNRKEGDIDFAVLRENTEEFYINCGGIFKAGTPDEIVIENAVHTRKGVERIIRYAFEFAVKYNRKSVLMSDKGNAMVYAGDLWKRVFEEIGAQYPQIQKKHIFIDALHMELIKNPKQFEVIVTSNCFGDILTDATSQIQGGMGLGASANINPENKMLRGMYEPIHGSAPDIAGQGKANPMASVLSLGLLLEDQGLTECRILIEKSVKATLEKGVVTPDLGGNYNTDAVGDFLCRYIKDI